MQQIVSAIDPLALASIAAGLLLFGLLFYFYQSWSETRTRSNVRKRLEIEPPSRSGGPDKNADRQRRTRTAAREFAKRANDFYATSDPKSIRKMQMQLVQAGHMHENALGYFITARFGLGAVSAGLAGLLVLFVYTNLSLTNNLLAVMMMAMIGYFLPNMHVNRRIKQLQRENRAGFPDVMDLMIVAAEAGLTMEASIDRIALEIRKTYPNLSRQLTIAGIEIRAGRPLDQALRAFGERLGLEEVQGFATMVQQSKELGTSVSDALRVYSEEMRHKRMMAAEEKAYALPAKLSIPVTGFILPVVIGVAVLPTVVRLMNH